MLATESPSHRFGLSFRAVRSRVFLSAEPEDAFLLILSSSTLSSFEGGLEAGCATDRSVDFNVAEGVDDVLALSSLCGAGVTGRSSFEEHPKNTTPMASRSADATEECFALIIAAA